MGAATGPAIKQDAMSYLNHIRNKFAGRPLAREEIRRYCRDRGYFNADAVYRRLVDDRSDAQRILAASNIFNAREAVASVAIDEGDGAQITLAEPIDEEEFDRVAKMYGRDLSRKRLADCPASPLKVMLPLLITRPEPVAIFSDLHIPAHDARFIDRCIDKALDEGVTWFILAGDITDNNQWHPKRGLQYRTERTWQQDIDLARSVLAHLCSAFPQPTLVGDLLDGPVGSNVVFFGNHDERILNMTKGQATTDWLYSYLFPNLPIHWTYKRQVRLIQEPYQEIGRFMICHGESFSAANPMGVVEKYALNNRCSVIAGHMHYAVQWETGPYQLILNGGCFDRTRQDYIHEKPLPLRETQQGFTIIKDGYASLYRGSDPTW